MTLEADVRVAAALRRRAGSNGDTHRATSALDLPGPLWVCHDAPDAAAVASCGRSGLTYAELCASLEHVRGRAVAILADNDAAWSAKLRESLRACGVTDVRTVSLGTAVGAFFDARDGKAPDEIAAEFDDAFERADPWRACSLGAILADPATFKPVEYVPTGFAELDGPLGGGLRCGGVTLLAGQPGVAKTTTAIQIGLNAALAGTPVGILSLEMSRAEVAQLILAKHANVRRRFLERGTVYGEPGKCVVAALATLQSVPLTVCDDERWDGALTRTKLTAIVADGVRRFGWKLVILDYVGLIAPEPDDGDNAYAADVANSATMKRIARKHGVALLCVADIRKPGPAKSGSRSTARIVTLDDVRGSARTAYDAFNVFHVGSVRANNGPGKEPTGIVKLFCLKGRFGGDDGREVQLRWYPATGRILDLERGEPEAESDIAT